MKLHKRLTSYITFYPGLFSGILLTSLLSALMIIFQADYISEILDDVFMGGKNLSGVKPLLFYLLIVSLLKAGLTWSGRIFGYTLSSRIKTRLRFELLNHIHREHTPSANDNRDTQATVISEGIEALEAYFSTYLPQVLLAALVPVLILIYVFPIDVISGLVLLFTAPVIPVFMVLIGSAADRKSRTQWKLLGRMSSHFLDVLRGLKTLILAGKAEASSRDIDDISQNFRIATMRVLKIAFLSALVLEMAATISTAVIAVEVGLRLLYDQLPFKLAIFILMLAPDFYQPIRQLGSSYHAGLKGIAAADDIFAILDQPYTTKIARHIQPAGDKIERIDLTNIVVQSDTSADPILRDLSMTVRQGERLVIIGPSGSGKTTLFNVLLGFLQPDSGSMRCNGIDSDALNKEALRKEMIWIPQRPYIFNQSIADNLSFVNPAATAEEMVAACRMAEFHDFVSRLPDGYQTRIGEEGYRLSAGQKQRLALARGFLSKGSLILMDEPTSHLDARLETKIWNRILKFSEGRILMVITHKLHLIAPSDRVALLVDGHIIQNDRHRDLIVQEGSYRDLMTLHGELI